MTDILAALPWWTPAVVFPLLALACLAAWWIGGAGADDADHVLAEPGHHHDYGGRGYCPTHARRGGGRRG